VDRELSQHSAGLELHEAEIAQFRMPSTRVVEALNVVEHIGTGFAVACIELACVFQSGILYCGPADRMTGTSFKMFERQNLWGFALALYGAPGVSGACLKVQESIGADVPLLIWSVWIGVDGRELTKAEITAAQNAVSAWHQQIVRPLRDVRQRMKFCPDPAPSEQTEALRNRLKSVELGAEKIELALLETVSVSALPGTTTPARAIHANLRAILAGDIETLDSELDHILKAAINLPKSETDGSSP
jgi:uncharacterized protein (TIGR02444 family)